MNYLCTIFFLMLILCLHSGAEAKKKEIQKAAAQMLEKDGASYKSQSCQNIAMAYVKRMAFSNKTDEGIRCLLKNLQTSNTNAWHWSYLGQLYSEKGEKSKAATCFKQAAKLDGKVSSFVKEWHFLGPFVIGKAEVDGDPVESFGGIEKISKRMFDKKQVFYSELVPGGKITWKTYTQKQADDSMQISPEVNWNNLVSSLGSFAVTEWQGWVLGEFAVNAKEDISFQCLGVHTVFVDKVVIAADVYRRTDFWFTLTLDPGIHRLYIRLRAKSTQVFQCNIKIHDSSSFLIHAPPMVPDIVENTLMGNVLAIPITNLQGSKWLENIRVKVMEETGGQKVQAALQNARLLSIAPGQTIPIIVALDLEGTDGQNKCRDVSFRLQISVGSVKEAYSVPILLRCRNRHQSFLFSFLDHDGSVQQAAAIEPLNDCKGGQCPVVLTLHGTGVAVQDQADSYKRLENDEWLFGLEKAWILAPTRHGAHNWEGPGTLTSMTALQQLHQLISEVPWMPNKPSPTSVIFAGHSMGGHGAWHLATHYPDRALAVVSLAGWIKKEEYGDSNVFFRHDISTSHTDPAVKHILEACIAENDADRHVSNIKGLPVYTRIGANDRTVHPYFVRRMNRLLKEQGANVTYSELEGKEHWWWDTWKTNDGGTVNDPKLRDFTNYYAEIPPSLGQFCEGAESSATCSPASTESKYSKNQQTGAGEVTLTVVNPALGEGLKGVRVLQQLVPFRTSTIQMNVQGDSATLVTTNVARFSVTDLDYIPWRWRTKSLEIDGTKIESDNDIFGGDQDSAEFCVSEKGSWEACGNELRVGNTERGPDNYGPARRIAEHRFLIVTGTLQEAFKESLRHLAVYLANLFFLTSDTVAMVTEDSTLQADVAAEHNLIIIGGPSENSYAQQFLDRVPLRIENNVISLGRCRFTNPATGSVFLAPNEDRLAFVLMGNSLEGIQNAMRLASPTIPPMTRSPFSNMVPDYIVTGPDFKAKGPGGYLCSGFWGNTWDYRLDTSSCVC